MKKLGMLSLLGLFALATGCSGNNIKTSNMSGEVYGNNYEVQIIQDAETRESYLDAVTGWMDQNGYKYEVDAEGTKHDNEKVTVEYIGRWHWDLATYMSYSQMTGFNDGGSIGTVSFSAGNLPSKFGSAEKRIQLMLDVLFGRKTVAEAEAEL